MLKLRTKKRNVILLTVQVHEPGLLPTISIDSHFAYVPRLEEVQFDAHKCADLLTHPNIGIARDDLPRIHIYLRPDYKLAYSREERRAIREAHPDDYTDAGSCETLGKASPFGRRGDLLITIVYDAGSSPNALLCHEAIHAQKMLDRRVLPTLGRQLIAGFSQRLDSHLDDLEEKRADAAMKDVVLKGLRKGVIRVIRSKKK